MPFLCLLMSYSVHYMGNGYLEGNEDYEECTYWLICKKESWC